MALVKKSNTEYTVPEEKVGEYLAMGYSLIDESGKVIQKGSANTKEEYLADNKSLRKENSTLKKELAEKNEKIEELTKQVEDLKHQLADTKTDNTKNQTKEK